MHQNRLNSLLLIFTEPELTSNVGIDMVIDEFRTMENKWINL